MPVNDNRKGRNPISKVKREETAAAAKRHRSTTAIRVSCAVVTVSDTRKAETDVSGRLVRDLLAAAGHQVCHSEIVADEPTVLADLVSGLCEREDCHAVLINGGTGISARDRTFEALEALFDKRLDGFGELFRALSYQQIGSRAMLSRAVAGVCSETLVFAMPGSPDAVRLAMEKLIIPGLGHTVAMVRGH